MEHGPGVVLLVLKLFVITLLHLVFLLCKGSLLLTLVDFRDSLSIEEDQNIQIRQAGCGKEKRQRRIRSIIQYSQAKQTADSNSCDTARKQQQQQRWHDG